MSLKFLAAVLCVFMVSSTGSLAADIKYRGWVTLGIGQSVVLKGVRNGDCDDTVPSWDHVRRGLPKSKLGTFSDGGKGTVQSKSCGKRVGARAVRFTAKKSGREQLVIFADGVQVTVK